jgi:hypothetical protein
MFSGLCPEFAARWPVFFAASCGAFIPKIGAMVGSFNPGKMFTELRYQYLETPAWSLSIL